jgi:phage tail P2-like protein
MDNLYGLDLLKILPSSISGDKNVQAAAKAIDPEMKSVSQDIREALILSRIDELSEPVIDLLAWQWHVDFYELARTLEMKRATVKDSIPWHRKKGTRWAIKKALEMIGVEAEIIEWWRIAGAIPYTFAVTATVTDEFYLKNPNWAQTTRSIRRAIEESKAARSWLLSFTAQTEREISGTLYQGGATATALHTNLRPERPEAEPSPLTAGTASFVQSCPTIGLQRPALDVTNTYAGMSVVVTVALRNGKLNAPRPPFEIWPSFTKAGVAASTYRRATLYPSPPSRFGRISAGMAANVINFITLTQEAM